MGWVGWGGIMDSDIRRLIVVVGVEVSEVGVGVGLAGELRVEVLVPLLQHQVVFVEGLRDGEQSAAFTERPIKKKPDGLAG